MKDRFRISSNNHSDKSVAALYWMGLIMFIPLVILFFYLRTDAALDVLIKGGYSCSFKRMTGLNCPGCGGTRASIYLARLKILESLRMNAAVIVSVVLYLYFMIKESMHVFLGTAGVKEKHVYIMVCIFAVTVIIRWVVSNYQYIAI